MIGAVAAPIGWPGSTDRLLAWQQDPCGHRRDLVEVVEELTINPHSPSGHVLLYPRLGQPGRGEV